ncbi:hypothetical protein M1M90_02240 [Thermodesulfovibrionales bacterium]|nr:hypothetical protein [Thermodesulfovibrionales bacterium]
MSKHSKYDSDKLVSYGKNTLFVGDSFVPSAEEIFPEGVVVSCHLEGHY